jgi:hypothetical protein
MGSGERGKGVSNDFRGISNDCRATGSYGHCSSKLSFSKELHRKSCMQTAFLVLHIGG